jgi:hypothetical protein
MRGAQGFSISSDDDLVSAQRGLTEEILERIVGRQVVRMVAWPGVLWRSHASRERACHPVS